MEKEKIIPTLYSHKKDCCGCTACYAICPCEAITMEMDREGFEYPHINKEKCVNCKLCLKVCPLKNEKL